jgi:regulator of sigma E protease
MLGFPLLEFIYLVLGFGFLIFVHELGHFAVAKWVKIRCPQFAIGFGKAMFAWRKGIGFRVGSTEQEYMRRCVEKLKADGVEPAAKGPHTGTARYDTDVVTEEHDSEYTGKQVYAVGDAMGLGETEYRLNYLPLGGYVKMLGQEDMDPNAKSDDPNAYNNKPIWARACVISAGVVMNMIFGAIFLAIAFLMGVQFPKATVGAVLPSMPAATTYAEDHDGDLRYLGLREGDVITSVNGKTPEDFKDVAIAVALSSSDSEVTLVVERRGEEEPLTYKLTPERQKGGERLLSAGFEAGPGLRLAYDKEAKGDIIKWFDARLEAVPAEERSSKQMIRIAKVNGEPVASYPEYLAAFDASDGEPVRVTLEDPAEKGVSKTFDVRSLPTLVRQKDLPAHLLGMVPAGRVIQVSEGSPAEDAGLKQGDLLIKVGDATRFNSVLGLQMTILDNPDTGFEFVVLRKGEVKDLGTIEPNDDGIFGLRVEPAYDTPVVAQVLDGLPAEALDSADGFLPGTTITHINDQPVGNWADIQRVLRQLDAQDAEGGARPEQIKLTFELPVKGTSPESVELKLTGEDYDAIASAGWQPDHTKYVPMTEFVTVKADGVGDALLIGVDKSRDFVLQTYITLLRLIQGDVKLYNLRGPVGIISTGTQVAQQGIPYLLFFLGLISINLAVINFLPIPIVDGGHMVFLGWEKITGKPPSEKVQVWSLYAGLAIIGFVFIATFYFDVMREIGRIF